MEPRTIQITETDLKKLREAMQSSKLDGYRGSPYLQQLAAELDRAEVVSPRELPADESDISFGASIITAMIGYCVGDVIEWDIPGGKASLHVEQILYQPEVEGVLD